VGCETMTAGRGRRGDHVSVGFGTGGWSWLGASSTVPRGFGYEGGSAFGMGVTGTREDNTARDDHDVDEEDVSRGESDTTSMLPSFVTRLVQLLEGYVGNDDRNKEVGGQDACGKHNGERAGCDVAMATSRMATSRMTTSRMATIRMTMSRTELSDDKWISALEPGYIISCSKSYPATNNHTVNRVSTNCMTKDSAAKDSDLGIETIHWL